MADSPMTIDQLQELMDFLTEHEIPDGYRMGLLPPKMTHEQAFRLIWFLQERYGIIPDSYEMCDGCGYVYDSYEEGISLDSESHMRCGEYRNYPLAKKWDGKKFHDDCMPFCVVGR